MTQRPALSLLLKFAKPAVILLIFAFIFLALWRSFDELREANLSLNLRRALVSFPFAVAYLVGRSMIWHLIVRRMIRSFPLRVDMLSWLASVIGKYVPGKVFLLLGRVHFYRGSGATVGQVTLPFLIELCASCLAASIIFGLAVMVEQAGVLQSYAVSVCVAAAVLAMMTHPRVLTGVLNAGLRVAKRPPVSLNLRWLDVWKWTLLMAANWMVLGTGFFLLLSALVDLPLNRLLYVTGSFALAGVIGMLALFAPSGIGVREGIMAAALSQILPTGVAVMAALVARVWMTLAEVFCASLALLLFKLLGIHEELRSLQQGEDDDAPTGDAL